MGYKTYRNGVFFPCHLGNKKGWQMKIRTPNPRQCTLNIREIAAPPQTLILQWSNVMKCCTNIMITQSIGKFQQHLYVASNFLCPPPPQKRVPFYDQQKLILLTKALRVEAGPPSLPLRRPLASEKAWCSYSARLVLFGKGDVGRIVIFHRDGHVCFATRRGWYLTICVYIPGTRITLVLREKGLLLEVQTPK